VGDRPAGRLTRKGRRSKSVRIVAASPRLRPSKSGPPRGANRETMRADERRRRGASGLSGIPRRGGGSDRRGSGARRPARTTSCQARFGGHFSRSVFRRGASRLLSGRSVLRAHARDSVDSRAHLRPPARSSEHAACGVSRSFTANAIPRAGTHPVLAVARGWINTTFGGAFVAGGSERFACRTEKW